MTQMASYRAPLLYMSDVHCVTVRILSAWCHETVLLLQTEFDKADGEKHRMEQKQRATRKKMEEEGSYKPRWFTADAEATERLREDEDDSKKSKKIVSAWKTKGEYWAAKAASNFEGCDDIFDHAARYLSGDAHPE